MEKNLRDLYAEKYMTTQAPSNQAPAQVVEESKKGKPDFKKGKKSPKKAPTGGEWTPEMYDDSTRFENIFGNILATLKEDFDTDVGGTDDTFNFDDEDGGEGEDETVQVSAAAIRGIIEQLQALIGEGGDFEGEDEGADFGGDEGGDDIPLESYGPDGAGQNFGAQGDYSGKAGMLPDTDLVEPNSGNAKFGKSKVGAKPNKSTGSLGKSNGSQDVRNGKAGKLPDTNLVKGNGDADFSKNKTGYGKAKGEDLY